MAIEKVREYFKQQGIEERIREFDVFSAAVEQCMDFVSWADVCKPAE